VYIGSYSGRFFALDAQSGRPRWISGGHGKISGAATVIGDIVYFSDLSHHSTVGLGARTGRRVFDFGRGGFNAAISDGRTLFVNGYSSLYALRPLSATGEKRAKASARHRRYLRVKARRHRRYVVLRQCTTHANRTHAGRHARARSRHRCLRRHGL
jgi:outer membrane protein assembly factor BamB